MRYFFVSYKCTSKKSELESNFAFESEKHPNHSDIKEDAKNLWQSVYLGEEYTPLLTNIHEFKNKTDYENFIK